VNASGKTTLLRIVLGDLQPQDGQVSYPSLSLRSNDWITIKNQIAFVSQSPDRCHGTLRNNLAFAAAVHGTTGTKNDQLVDWYVQRYGLEDYADATWDVISGVRLWPIVSMLHRSISANDWCSGIQHLSLKDCEIEQPFSTAAWTRRSNRARPALQYAGQRCY
jgi:hypothetical protein